MASSAQNKQNSASLSSAQTGEILAKRSERVHLQRELVNLRQRREFNEVLVAMAKQEDNDYQDLCDETDVINTEIDSVNKKLRRLG
jgi:seryl-tRNA synthetase|tara:strand:+ start:567 stop:824 length:258 start_codon:yes stop_codon:yes gene_type:complete